ncbi:MAG: hypothetical protein ACLQDM_19660, partial [Bradyrhizobium sp.]
LPADLLNAIKLMLAVQSCLQKDFDIRFTQISNTSSPSRLGKRGVRVVTNVGRDAMDAAVSTRRTTLRRTAKSCGPGAPTLALSWR